MSEQGPEQKRRLPTIAIVGIILAVLCGISLYIRAYLPHDQIFVNDAVWFRETDAYYHMRYIEALVHHFPDTTYFDPYILYPGGGAGTARQPFFDLLISAIILLVSRGVPTLHTMEVIAAYMPAILGTLVLIPVYFIGKELFNRWAGVISAALVVILPGEFLHRSLLGFTDHHVAEVLFSTVCMLFLIMAIKRAREREISFSHILSRDWSTVRKPLVYTLLAGIFLGVYLLSWWGGLMFVFIIFVYLVIQFIVDHLRHKSSDYLCVVGTPLFLIAFLMLLPILGTLSTVDRVSLLFAILAPIGLSIISRLMAGRAWKPVYYPLALVGLAGIGLAAFRAINPSLFQSMFSLFGIFNMSGGWLTIMETTPLLSPEGTFTFSMAWANFTTSFFISFISLAMLAFVVVKERSADKTLFLVWSVMMLAAVLSQRRFGYYDAINAALLTGYFSWKMLDIAGLSKLLAKSREVVEAVKKFKKKKKKTKEKAKARTFMQPRGAWVSVIVAGIVLFFVVIFPSVGLWKDASTYLGGGLSIGNTKPMAQQAPMMDNGWYTACSWLQDKDNTGEPHTPEPFGDPDFYYELYLPQNEFEYPDTAYGVMSWWDYGYYIMQIGHRIPNANPGQAGAPEAGRFFTAQNETSANVLADELGTKYVMIDSAMVTGKFYAMAEWAGRNVSEFYGVYLTPSPSYSNALGIVPLYYPTYYNSTAVRLYNFDGQAESPSVNSTVAVSVAWITGEELLNSGYQVIIYSENKVERVNRGASYIVIVDRWFFSSYEEAKTYVAAQQAGNYDIGGPNPFVTTVPLQEMKSYERVYATDATISSTTVKIFRYLASGQS